MVWARREVGYARREAEHYGGDTGERVVVGRLGTERGVARLAEHSVRYLDQVEEVYGYLVSRGQGRPYAGSCLALGDLYEHVLVLVCGI